jgi:hypothetical protein
LNHTGETLERLCTITVSRVPEWVPAEQFLGPFVWERDREGLVTGQLPFAQAADLQARLRGVILDGHRIEVTCTPKVHRTLYRKALLAEARRMRQKTVLFSKAGTRLDAEGRLFVTPESIALKLARRATKRRVLDGFCGLGGNAIAFARSGCDVEAYEIDSQRLALAAHNARVYGVSIQFHAGDLLEALPRLRGDLLWLDPPWGDLTRQRCDRESFQIVNDVLGRITTGSFQEVWLKLPPTFDTGSLPEFRCEAVFGEGDGDRQRIKFILARFKWRGQ